MSGDQALERDILRDLADPRLVAALEANIAAAYADMARNPEGDIYSGPEMTRYISGVPTPILNGVVAAALPEDAEQLDALVEETIRRFAARVVPMMWWLGPSTSLTNLGARLEARGLAFAARPRRWRWTSAP